MGAGRRRRTCDHLFGLLFWVAQGHVPVLCRSVEIASCGCCEGGGVARFWLGRDPASLAGKGCGGRERIWKRQSRKRRGNLARCSTALDRDCASTGPGLAKKRLCKPGMLSVNVNGNCIIFVAFSSGRRERIWQSVDDRPQSRAKYDHNNAGRGKTPPHPHSAGSPLWDDALTST